MLDLSKLNDAQKDAVQSLDGPLLIVAGPGTGKTTVLTYRIAHILSSTDTKPQSILAMTFTEAGVHAMRAKLYEQIGAAAYNVMITTIHGFCNAVIQDYSEYFTHLQGFTALNDIERIKFTQHILEHQEFQNLAPVNAKDLYIPDLLSMVSTMKREYISQEKFAAAIQVESDTLGGMEKYVTRGPDKGKKVRSEYEQQERKIEKYKEVALFYDLYQKHLSEKKRYDYEDMILYVLDALNKNEELCMQLQEQYQYLMVDEYQDTNDAQNTLIFTLAAYWGDEANIFAVGDDDQAIYRFQGASVKNIADYLGKYPHAKVITLKENYRSQQKVLDASRTFIRNNTQSLENTLGSIDKSLISRAIHPSRRIRLAHFMRGEAENLFLADKIIQLTKKQGASYNDIAVIVRNNADMDSIVDMFQRKKIPYVRKAGDNALDNYYVKQLLDFVKLTVLIGTNDINDLLLVRLLHYPYLNVPKLDLLRIGRAYADNRLKTFWEYLVEKGEKKTDLGVMGVTEEAKVSLQTFFDKIVTWNNKTYQEPLVKMLEIIMHESGLLDHVLGDKDKIKHLNALNSFFAEVKALNVSEPDMVLAEFLQALELMNQFHIPIKEKELGVVESGVQIMTAHSSKGLEFSYVFIPQLVTGKWDHRRHISKLSLPTALTSNVAGEQDTLEEDRRLFYVALTRARKKVYASFSDVYATAYGNDRTSHKSQFVDEVPAKYFLKLKVKKYTLMVQNHIAEMLAQRPFNTVYVNSVDEKEVIRGIVSRFELHPTGLNNYLECPMRFLLSNILRIPAAISPALAYGNAVHAALESLYKSKKVSLVPLSGGEFYDVFRKKLSTYPLRTVQIDRLAQRGKENLAFYYDQHIGNLVVPVKTEHKLSGVVSGAKIKGRVDRIDYVDSTNKFLKVIDYKTGHSISANAFDGLHPVAQLDKYNKDKAKAQRYFHQLLFYKVVADIDWWITSNTAEVVEGSLLFVDPEREHFVERIVAYQKDDVADMRELIVTTWQKIQRLEFARVHEPDEGCEYCSIGD